MPQDKVHGHIKTKLCFKPISAASKMKYPHTTANYECLNSFPMIRKWYAYGPSILPTQNIHVELNYMSSAIIVKLKNAPSNSVPN